MNDHITAAIDACRKVRQAERLFASTGFYDVANGLREWREKAERCTESSIAALRPSEGEYTPRTLAQLVEKANGEKEGSNG